METNLITKKQTNYLNIFLWICVGIIFTSIIYYVIVDANSDDRGTFGDMFGSLTAIFSGFAFAGVIITIIMQMKELELTRIELQRSADAQEKSQKALNEQLRSMQITSKIDSLNQYLRLIDKEQENDKAFIANQIIKETTENLFYSKEHDHITRPNLVCPGPSRVNRPPISKHGIECQFRLRNIGASLIDFEIQLPPQITGKSTAKSISNMGVLDYQASSDFYDFTVPIKYKGKIVENQWTQNLYLKIRTTDLEIWTSEPELIKRFNE